jgi:aryl-alcohol dehydrogenase-like predicted oxidoreductase
MNHHGRNSPGSSAAMPHRPLGRTGLVVPALGFGAFKIGRNEGIKYDRGYELPDDSSAALVLETALDLGLTLIDTAPAYGLSEARIGRHLAHRRGEFVLVTKVGEQFDPSGGAAISRYDFTPAAIVRSAEQSVERLGGPVDLLLVHADARDAALATDVEIVQAMERLRSRGVARHIGFSGKSAEGNRAALPWAEVVMVEYHADDRSAEPLLAECAARGVGVLVKKALASGRLDPAAALRVVLGNPHVDCAVVGGLDVNHLRRNAELAREIRAAASE